MRKANEGLLKRGTGRKCRSKKPHCTISTRKPLHYELF